MNENAGSGALSPLMEMNQIMAEKEAVISQKLEALKAKDAALKKFEKELAAKVEELKQEQQKLRQEREEFISCRQREQESMESRWKEVRAYEENLNRSMEMVMAEKVEQERRGRDAFEKQLDAEISLGEDVALALDEFRRAIGIEPEAGQVPETPVMEDMVSETPGHELWEEEPMPELQEEAVPEMFGRIQKEVEKVFKRQKPYLLECTRTHMCMQIGKHEFRVFDKDPHPELHLIMNQKRVRNDSIAMWGRMLPNWTFEARDSYLACEMLFTSDTNESMLVKNAKECMEKIEG